MVKSLVIFSICLSVLFILSFSSEEKGDRYLRKIYSLPPAEWPKPGIDGGAGFMELGPLPIGPLNPVPDSLRAVVGLGKMLFFDTRLSGSGKISCSSCHQPTLHWTDGRDRSVGHRDARNKRNSPSLQNVWFYQRLFWDGRSSSLEDQAFSPINSESEMAHDMRNLPRMLKDVTGYRRAFREAFGDESIDAYRITTALAQFQRTIRSRPTRFDQFLAGQRDSLTGSELRGLHLFRTRAGCLNCHQGPLFTDDRFHNNGFAGEDRGRYMVTHVDDDLGKFRTPSLRDVTKTGPWMHDGGQTDLAQIIDAYDKGRGVSTKEPGLRILHLSKRDKADLLSFLQCISANPLPIDLPIIPE